MSRFREVPGAALAVGAFVLTVLLGVGGASASALWQQSATATMTVTATGTWPAPAFPQPVCTPGDNSNKSVLLGYSGFSEAPTKLTLSAAGTNGIYGGSIDAPGTPGTTGTLVVGGGSDIFKNVTTTPATIKIVATFTGDRESTATVKVDLKVGTGSQMIFCTSTTLP